MQPPGIEHVVVTCPEPGIALVELARGKVNAVDASMYREIATVFEALSDDPEVRAVVLTGRGHVFCAGNDLGDFRTMDSGNGEIRMREARRALFAVLDCAVPVIAAVNGAALGSGFGFVALSDMVVASERATFGLPEMSVGVLGGGRFTARMLPQQAMRRLFFTAEPVDAATLFRWGAAVEVVAHEELRTAASRLARSVAAKGRHALGLAKQSLNRCEDLDVRRGYEIEQSFTLRLGEHPGSRAAVAERMAALGGGR